MLKQTIKTLLIIISTIGFLAAACEPAVGYEFIPVIGILSFATSILILKKEGAFENE